MSAVRRIVRYFGWATFLAVGGAVLIAITVYLYAQFENSTFATRFFDQPRLGKFNVLASKATHFSAFGCTFAIVQSDQISDLGRPSQNALSAFANSKRGSGYWPLPNQWRPTPFQPGNWNPSSWNFKTGGLNEGRPGYFAHCLRQAVTDDHDAILQALTASGGWFSVRGETVAFVLPSVGVVGMIRYGD